MTRLFVSYILVWYFLRIGQNMLGGVNRLERILPAFIGSIVVNLVVSVLAAQKLGLIGVVLGTVVGNITAFIPSIIVFRREFDLRWKDFSHEIILRVYPHALTGAFVVYFLIEFRYPASLVEVLVYSIIGGIVFLGLFLLRGIPNTERSALYSLGRRLLRLK